MTIRKAPRQPEELGSLELFAELDEPSTDPLPLNDPRRIAAATSSFARGLEVSLDTPSRLQGWWAQGMFAAVVLALGSTRLVAVEDAGPGFYFDDSDGPVKAPDYRVVTKSGEHLLVEVKSVAPADTLKKQILKRSDLEGGRRYAEWTNARLLFAHYWSQPNLWTLVDADAVNPERGNGSGSLTLVEALPSNELGLLGDTWIGTTPPLALSMIADRTMPRALEDLGNESTPSFTCEAVEMSCQGRVLESSLERTIAWSLMAFGGWSMEKHVEVDQGNQVLRVDFTFKPAEPVEVDQGFEIVGPVSSLYSALYSFATLDEAGEVSRLSRPPEPEALVNFIPSDYWDKAERALPLWRLDVQRSP